MTIALFHLPQARKLARTIVVSALLLTMVVVGSHVLGPHQSKATPAPKVVIDHFSLSHVYSSWGELKGASTLVVIGSTGSPQAAHPQFVGHHVASEVWTQTPITIEQTLLGAAPPSLSVLQSGQPSTGNLVVESDFPILLQGQRYLLFLTPSPIPGQWYPVGAPQGVFTITSDAKVNMYTDVGIAVHDLPLDQVISTEQAATAIPLQQ